jgi:hypothetical protein
LGEEKSKCAGLAQQHSFGPASIFKQNSLLSLVKFAESGQGLFTTLKLKKTWPRSFLLLLFMIGPSGLLSHSTTAPCSWWLVQVVCYLTHYCSLFLMGPSGLLSVVVSHLFVIPILVFWWWEFWKKKKKSK